ncbi:WD40-repeat-containing domain protein [Cercophora samala]|uniref:WD40-repeat-containing domain protein n=1 Tax=Cercophora samala TaxID=330535 RepID=A0AA39Z7Z3_9PEZI|nr:WD40-repeat-containing domain protein [Cercophora samala]
MSDSSSAPPPPPPPFRATVEESLSVPSFGNGSGSNIGDNASITSSTRRRWDDPPDEEPGQMPSENMTSMVFVKIMSAHHANNTTTTSTGEVKTAGMQGEVSRLVFTPRDTHVAALVPKHSNVKSFDPDESGALAVWAVKEESGRVRVAHTSYYGVRVHKGFAFRPGAVGELVVACPFYVKVKGGDGFDVRQPMVEVYDVGKRIRWSKSEVPMRAPLVMSEDGGLVAGVSSKDGSRVVVCGFGGNMKMLRVKTMVIKHTEEVTGMGFLPEGAGLVTAGRDGYVRVTDLHSGRTLKRIEIGARAACSILQVSGDGKMVVTVWGRDVVLWYLETGRVHNYNLNVVRQAEGWPLAVSKDCRYLACRTEDGFDVSDVASGAFRGDFATLGSVITAAAFSNDCTKIAVGDFDGPQERKFYYRTFNDFVNSYFSGQVDR